MTIEVVAWSPEDGLALIVMDGLRREVRPPFGADPPALSQASEADALLHWGYRKPPETERFFPDLKDLYAHLDLAVAPTLQLYRDVAAQRKPLKDTPVAQANPERLRAKIMDLRKNYITEPARRRALRYLAEFMELDNVKENRFISKLAKKINIEIKNSLSSKQQGPTLAPIHPTKAA